MQELINEIITGLDQHNLFIKEQAIDKQSCEEIRLSIKKLIQEQKMYEAGVGVGESMRIEATIRESMAAWIIDWNITPSLERYYLFLETLQKELNRHFFLGLRRHESQYAFYATGGFYKKHYDQHQGFEHRKVTNILYLNECQAGELIIYDPQDKEQVLCKVSPKPGTLVTFFSANMLHQVVPTATARYSITSWFRDDEYLF
jgi:SM-20-related protein